MLQLQGPKNIFWLLTADNAGALTVCIAITFFQLTWNVDYDYDQGIWILFQIWVLF